MPVYLRDHNSYNEVLVISSIVLVNLCALILCYKNRQLKAGLVQNRSVALRKSIHNSNGSQ
jgi:hypothetical protein